MSTFERWKQGRPIRDSLPGINGGYDNEPSDWLTAASDELIYRTKLATVDDGERQVDPRVCDEQWLDLIASVCGWHGIWDKSWPVQSKRALLSGSYTNIWPFYGTSKALSFVLNALGISHVIQEGQSFIVGQNKVGDELGLIAWRYNIILPSSFFNTPEFKTVERINKLFGPIWCKSQIVFNDKFFREKELFVIAEGESSVTLLALDNRETILELKQ